MSGKKAAMVKTCLAYIGSKIYSPKHVLNCGTITSFYGIKSKQYVYNNYQNYLLNLEQGKPDPLKLNRRKLTPKTYRDRADIMADFLKAAAGGTKKLE